MNYYGSDMQCIFTKKAHPLKCLYKGILKGVLSGAFLTGNWFNILTHKWRIISDTLETGLNIKKQ